MSIGIYNDPGYRSARTVTASDVTTVNESIAVAVTCTVAGNVAIKLVGGANIIVAVAVGTVILPFAAIGILSTGTTATATYYFLN